MCGFDIRHELWRVERLELGEYLIKDCILLEGDRAIDLTSLSKNILNERQQINRFHIRCVQLQSMGDLRLERGDDVIQILWRP